MSSSENDEVPDEVIPAEEQAWCVAEALSLLRGGFQPEAAMDWLNAPSIHACDGGGTPMDLIRRGRWDVLRVYAEEAVSGAYG